MRVLAAGAGASGAAGSADVSTAFVEYAGGLLNSIIYLFKVGVPVYSDRVRALQ
jgi:hypothetical protein